MQATDNFAASSRGFDHCKACGMVLACTTCISVKIAALEGQVTAINTAMTASPNDLDFLGRKIDAEDKLEYARQQLLEEPEMVLTMDGKAVHTNAHRLY